MKRLLIILGFFTAVLAVILAVTPLSNLAVIPVIIGFVCGLLILFFSKKNNFKTKSIQYIFLLVTIALAVTVYKGIFNTTEMGDTEELEVKEEESVEDSKEILEGLDIEDIDIDS